MSFDAGRLINNIISSITNLTGTSSKSNTREAEKNMQAQQFFARFDSPDEDLQIDTKKFQNNLKYAIPTNFDEGQYADEADDKYEQVMYKYGIPQESIKKYAIPEHIEMDKYAVPPLRNEGEEPTAIVASYYGILVDPEPKPSEIGEPEIHTDYGIQVYPEPEPSEIGEPEVHTDYGIQVEPSQEPTEIIHMPLYGMQVKPDPMLKYAMPTIEPEPSPSPFPGGSGGIGNRSNPWRKNLTEIFSNIFNRTTTSFYDRMSEVFNRIFPRSRR